MRKFGPKTKDHPSIGELCLACKKPFKDGDYTTLVVLGPGDDPEQQKKARDGRPYSAVAQELHWGCSEQIDGIYCRECAVRLIGYSWNGLCITCAEPHINPEKEE